MRDFGDSAVITRNAANRGQHTRVNIPPTAPPAADPTSSDDAPVVIIPVSRTFRGGAITSKKCVNSILEWPGNGGADQDQHSHTRALTNVGPMANFPYVDVGPDGETAVALTLPPFGSMAVLKHTALRTKDRRSSRRCLT
jgi:hypothetical protein